jgi:hypothetical protein
MKKNEPVAKQTNENLLECLNVVCVGYRLCGRPRSCPFRRPHQLPIVLKPKLTANLAANNWQVTVPRSQRVRTASAGPTIRDRSDFCGVRVGVGVFCEAQNPCGALYWPFPEWWIESRGADALRSSETCTYFFLEWQVGGGSRHDMALWWLLC